jgi:hypothetical protein
MLECTECYCIIDAIDQPHICPCPIIRIDLSAGQVVQRFLPHFWFTDVHCHFVNAAPDTNEQLLSFHVYLCTE